ncbi:TIGR00341 family protein [Halolamina salifodinae]|uniref:Putative hydrophobic protein (TIGR00341 family) n=1 Tax=Halolamina salifodinae TaxID=1202767 RepID=A0A8T4GTX6_9EURY|nr:TIGR00341 family protein [Halolamina salifodinae]MBP1986316.1 putative hydrophobic protein (TIGR00341 family) [Halolamina salifodinae]
MRLVQVMIPAGKRDAVLSVLDENGIDYALSDETSGRRYTGVVSFPLPTNAVEPILDQLREETGIDREAYTVVLDAETVISERYEQLAEEWTSGEEGDRIARDELTARAADLAPDWVPFLMMTAISAVVATAGLLLDSPAVVVGSMVIAPLIGPAMATSVGSVVDDHEMFVRGIKLQTMGALLAVMSAAAFAGLLRYGNIIPLGTNEVLAVGEVRERLSPGVPSLVVALAAGIAGALSLSSGVSSALVGVMIAAALVPPTAVVGIGIAWGRPGAVLGSAVLVAVNFLSINLVALVVFWYQGYQPEEWFKADEARKETAQRAGALILAVLIFSSVLVGATYAATQRAAFADDTRAETEALLEEQPSLSLVSFQVEHGAAFPFRTPERVVVTVGHPPGTDPPAVAATLADRIEAIESGRFGLGGGADVQVEVHYTAVETSGSVDPAPQALRDGGMSGSQSTASTTVSSTSSTFSPSATLM